MYVLKKPRLIFLAHPRTASQSIVQWLKENFDVEQSNSTPSFPPMWGDHHGINLVSWPDLMSRGYSAFCVVRNHWDWVLSCAMMDGAVTTGEPQPVFFEKWIESHLKNYTYIQQQPSHQVVKWEPQRKTAFWLYPQLCDTVLRYENLAEELFAVTIGSAGEASLPTIGAIPRSAHLFDYYTDLGKEIVHSMFRYEIELYGYEFPTSRSQERRLKVQKEAHWSGAGAVVVMPTQVVGTEEMIEKTVEVLKPKPLTLDELEDQAIYADVEAAVAKDEVLKPKPKRRPTPKAVKKDIERRKKPAAKKVMKKDEEV